MPFVDKISGTYPTAALPDNITPAENAIIDEMVLIVFSPPVVRATVQLQYPRSGRFFSFDFVFFFSSNDNGINTEYYYNVQNVQRRQWPYATRNGMEKKTQLRDDWYRAHVYLYNIQVYCPKSQFQWQKSRLFEIRTRAVDSSTHNVWRIIGGCLLGRQSHHAQLQVRTDFRS